MSQVEDQENIPYNINQRSSKYKHYGMSLEDALIYGVTNVYNKAIKRE